MRGVYTAGALDYFLDAKLVFPYIYGVSAGACHACSYASGQRGRAARTVLDFAGDRRYGSFRNLLTTGDYFSERFVYGETPNRLLPFDYEAFRENAERQAFFAVVTNLETGKAEYRRMTDLRADMDWLRASASLPLLSRDVEIGGQKYLDGGIADSIPLARSIADGHAKNVLVLTRPNGYRKPASGAPLAGDGFVRWRYRKYPEFVKSVLARPQTYNAALELAEAEAAAGRALLVQPENALGAGRLERDAAKLRALYERGYADAKACLAENSGFFEG
jgi:predicted patatin/cPLA2 family phospholipase